MNKELLSIDLSNYCSKQCPFCYNHSTRDGNVMWTPEEVISFARDCVAHGIKAVSLGGGEPFEYEGVFDVIDALFPITYLSVTSNGLPLLKDDVWKMLEKHRPDKVHLTIHNADNAAEVARITGQLSRLDGIGIKPGVNLLVPASKLEACAEAYRNVTEVISSDQVILIPQRFSDTPTPKQLASVSGGKPFQSPSCILRCDAPEKFISVSWDKKVNHCSYAGGKRPLETLDWAGVQKALDAVEFRSCLDSRSEYK